MEKTVLYYILEVKAQAEMGTTLRIESRNKHVQ